MNVDVSQVKKLLVNNKVFNLPEGETYSLEEIKTIATQLDVGLANADPVVEGETLSFVRRAGTKGAADYVTKVVFNNQVLTIDPEIHDNPVDIKEALTMSYPEVANYDYTVSEGTMTFIKKAGTKG